MPGINSSNRKTNLLIIIIYVAGALYLFPWLRYFIDYTDTFSYIVIAEKYHSGNFYGAINSTWSPLISWILSLLMFSGIDSILLFKLLQVFLGFSALMLVSIVIDRIKITGALTTILKISLVPCILSYSLLWCTPDLLFLNILLAIYLLFLKEKIDLKTAAFIGIAGGLMYLSKAYGIFYFPVLCVFGFAILLTESRDKDHRKFIVKCASLSLAIFLAISAIWASMISAKYGRFMVSYAASYNSSDDVAPTMRKESVHKIISSGLYDPTPNNSLFAWEDPALYSADRVAGTNTFSLEKKLLTVQRNVLTFYYYQYRNQIGWCFAVMLCLGIILLRKKMLHRSILIMTFTCIILPAGYFFFLIVSRYLWAVSISMAIVSILICQMLIRENKIKWVAWGLALITCALLVKRPVKELFWVEDTEKSIGQLADGILHSSRTLEETYSIDRDAFAVADSLRNRMDMKGRVAGFDNPPQYFRESYSLAMIPGYYLHNTFFGQLNDTMIRRTGLQPLFDHHIDFYYVWVKDSLNELLVKQFPLLYEDDKTRLRIYKVKKSEEI